MRSDVRTMEILLKAGADVTLRSPPDFFLPLDVAAMFVGQPRPTSFEHVQLLIQHGADFENWIPVDYAKVCSNAIVAGDTRLVQLYLDHGCDANGRPVGLMHV